MFSDGLRYTKDHLWVKKFGLSDYSEKSLLGRNAYVGITEYLKNKLNEDRTWYLRAGKTLDKGQSAGIIYTKRHHVDIIMPVSGTVLQTNLDFVKPPFWSNNITEKDWIMVVEMHKPKEWNELLVAQEYGKYLTTIPVL